MINFEHMFLSTNQIYSFFADDIGNNDQGSGTGFWITHKSQYVFVTNRHMVDYAFCKNKQNFNLCKMMFWLRNDKNLLSKPQKYELNLNSLKILRHDTADVAIIYNIEIINSRNDFIHTTLSMVDDSLADDNFFQTMLRPADNCIFIGYPNDWWDESTGLPIVRLANLASWPKIDFINKGIKSTNVRLVAGLSFSGSSGSPIMNKGTEFQAGNGLSITGLVPPKIIGVMAGHWWDKWQMPPPTSHLPPPTMFQHSGLSYFVTSTVIHNLLKKI